MTQHVIHAAKVPENARDLTPLERRIRGIEYVNACDDKPWKRVSRKDFALGELKRCEVCAVIVEYQPRSK